MRGTPYVRAKLAFGRACLMRVAGLMIGAALMIGAVAVGHAHAEEVVIPYECDVRMGEVRLVPSEPRSYRILGGRDRQIYSACDPQDPGQCKNYQVHRFDVDCGGSRVPWLKIAEAAARLDGERVSVKRNQMLLEMEPRAGGQSEPYPDGRWDPDRRNSGDPYGIAQGDAVVSFPPGFAPAIGMKPIFTGRDPSLAQQLPPTQGMTSSKSAAAGFGVPYDAEEGGWETQAKGWSQSPRGEPIDQEAERGWDAERVISGSERDTKSTAKAAPQGSSNTTLAGSKASGANYGSETVTSQQLPEIGAPKPKASDPAKKTTTAATDAAKPAQKKPAVKTAEASPAKTSPPPKAEAKSEPVEAPLAKAEAPKVEEPKPEPAKAEIAKSDAKPEPPKADAQKIEAAKSEPPKTEATPAAVPAQPTSPLEPQKTDTSMLEQAKEPKREAPLEAQSPSSSASAAPAPSPAPEAPQMINGRDAATAHSPSSPPQETAVATPPPVAPAPSAPQTAQSEPAAASPSSTVVAEATFKPQQQTSDIETSSISIGGQKVPTMPALFIGAAALFTAAGFYFMMRRGQEAEVASYVERDFTRVTLGASGEAAARLAGPSFELPMPGLEPSERVMAPEPVALASALDGMGAVAAPTIEEPMGMDVILDGPVVEVAPVVEPVVEVSLPIEPEAAPEAVELARALADAVGVTGTAADAPEERA